MAYHTEGTLIHRVESKKTDKTGIVEDNTTTITNYVFNVIDSNIYCIAFYLEDTYDTYKTYTLNCYKKGFFNDGVQFGLNYSYNRTTTDNITGDTTTSTESGENITRIGSFSLGMYDIVGSQLDVHDEYYLSSSIPFFDDIASLKKYVNNGDTSGQILFINTDWTLYIDGKSNPLYKLVWNCDGIKDLDLTYTQVKLWVGKFNSFDDTISDYVTLKTVPYTDGRLKFSYNDLSKLIDPPIVGHNPCCLIMQLEYRTSPTVIPDDTSTKMAVDLYYDDSPQGSLYDNLGYISDWTRTNNGDGSTLTIKDGDEGSSGYESDDDGGYDDKKDSDDDDTPTDDVSAGIGVLTTTFKMTRERLVQLGQFLWGANIFDNFSLINNNPIENIISCKAIPIDTNGTTQEIVLGNVATGVNGEKISSNFGKQNIGTITISEYYHNFLDYSPYTNVIVYLPYIGFKELDTSMVMGKKLNAFYTVDSITGGCLAQLSVGGVKLYEFTGNVGIDIPITASNRAQVEAGYIQAGVGAVASVATGNVASAVTSLVNSATAQYHYSSSGNPNPMCVASTNRTCYVIIDRPQYQNLNAFNHTRGRKCNLSKTIKTLSGYTICDSHIDLSGISATETEKEEIVDILSSGFFA